MRRFVNRFLKPFGLVVCKFEDFEGNSYLRTTDGVLYKLRRVQEYVRTR